MLRVFRCVLGSAVALAVLLGVTSCTPPLRGDLSLSVNDRGQTLVGICNPGAIDHVYAYFAVDKTDSGHKVFAADGSSVRVEKGEVWVLDNGVPGFELSFREQVHLWDGSKFSVLLLGTEGTHNLSGDFDIPEGGLEEGHWLFPDGSISDRMCGRFEDEHARIQERRGNDSNDDQ